MILLLKYRIDILCYYFSRSTVNHIKGIKRLPKQVNVWVITIDGTLSGWMSIDCLNELKKGKLKILIVYRFH